VQERDVVGNKRTVLKSSSFIRGKSRAVASCRFPRRFCPEKVELVHCAPSSLPLQLTET
jgi:hypothetical protein